MELIKIIQILTHPSRILYKVICICRSWLLTKRYVNKGNGRIIIQSPFLRLKIKKAKGSIFELNGNLTICSWFNGNTPINISLSSEAKFILNGDFILGQGVTIALHKGAELIIGGKYLESGSGITCNTVVLVYKQVKIGRDFICAWDVTITDSDWHAIVGTKHCKPVTIGDHVWIAQKSCVLKGSNIGEGSIIAACSKITNKEYPNRVLIGGADGKIIKENVLWERDINE